MGWAVVVYKRGECGGENISIERTQNWDQNRSLKVVWWKHLCECFLMKTAVSGKTGANVSPLQLPLTHPPTFLDFLRSRSLLYCISTLLKQVFASRHDFHSRTCRQAFHNSIISPFGIPSHSLGLLLSRKLPKNFQNIAFPP